VFNDFIVIALAIFIVAVDVLVRLCLASNRRDHSVESLLAVFARREQAGAARVKEREPPAQAPTSRRSLQPSGMMMTVNEC